MAKLISEIKTTIKNPGVLFLEHPRMRSFYNNTCDFILSNAHKRRKTIAQSLPPCRGSLKVPDEVGFRVFSPGVNPLNVQPLLQRCRSIMANPNRAIPKAGKDYLNHLVSPKDLAEYPEFIDFALNPDILSTATEYLGELPMLAGVYFWHAHTAPGAWKKSQLYHSDYDDIRQFKVFLFADEVTPDSGPLTLLPAHISEKIRTQLNNNNNRFGEYIDDEKIRPLIPEGVEKPLTGPAGTMAFADTSRVLHFGSRVENKDRYMVVFQFISLTNFIHSPFYKVFPYPYAHLVRPEHTLVQKAVLDSRIG